MATKQVVSTSGIPATQIVCNDCGARDDGWNHGGGLTVCEVCGPKQLPDGSNLGKLTLVCANCKAAHFAKHGK